MTEICEAMRAAADDPTLTDDVRKLLLAGAEMIVALRNNVRVSNSMIGYMAENDQLDLDETTVVVTLRDSHGDRESAFTLGEIMTSNENMIDIDEQTRWFSNLPPPPPLVVPQETVVIVVDERDLPGQVLVRA